MIRMLTVFSVLLASAANAQDITPQERAELVKRLHSLNDAAESAEAEWNRKYERVYYECREDSGEMTLEIFQAHVGGVRTPHMKIKPVAYSESATLRVYHYLDEDYEPTGNVLVMEPNGTTGAILKGESSPIGMWQCTAAPWPEEN